MLLKIYNLLLREYGPQHWWPVTSRQNPQLEIIIGAILTQNTAWQNVEKAIQNLKREKLFNAKKLAKIRKSELSMLIKPAGYFNQKAKKIKEFIKFYSTLKNRVPTRKELLNVWGIGPETADSILLYAYNQPFFVVDAYTKRIFTHLKLINQKSTYEQTRKLFEDNLPRNSRLYQEYHALIVEHAKRHYKRKPHGKNGPLKKLIKA